MKKHIPSCRATNIALVTAWSQTGVAAAPVGSGGGSERRSRLDRYAALGPLTRSRGDVMERGNTKHGPLRDDELARDTEDMVRASAQPGRVEEEREP